MSSVKVDLCINRERRVLSRQTSASMDDREMSSVETDMCVNG
jgi:hypothetical protein